MKTNLPVLFTSSVPSSSNPDKSYTVTFYADGSKWCGCPAFKFQRKPVADRSCKHTDFVAATSNMRKAA
jgi:hypothetical protein